MKYRRIAVALTIAGSDSGGGAGIEADLKTFAALGVHGVVAITSVTAQNTLGVYAVQDIPPKIVAKQIEAVAEDMGVDAAKTGMLSSSEIIVAVASTLRRYDFPLVIDPVMVAKSGAPLLRPDAVETLVKELIPRATLVTPNKMEAEKLAGIMIKSLDDARRAARRIVEEYGAEAAIVKGGHLDGDESVDVLYYRGRYREYRAPRIENGCTHGTGCSFSAAITAELAKGRELEEAVETAKRLVTMAIDYGLRIGGGHCPVNPMAWLEIDAWRWRVTRSVEEALARLLSSEELVLPYTPEVGINIAEALPYPYARSIGDVAGVLGRVVKTPRGLRAGGPVALGASSHLARLVLAVMRHVPWLRAVVNIRYASELVEVAEDLGYRVVRVDRSREPVETRAREGGTMEWIAESVFSEIVADVVYDEGDWGKEPMIRVFGENAVAAVEKLLSIVRAERRR